MGEVVVVDADKDRYKLQSSLSLWRRFLRKKSLLHVLALFSNFNSIVDWPFLREGNQDLVDSEDLHKEC